MNELKKNIISMYNDEGKEWLDSLPEITAKIAKEHINPNVELINDGKLLSTAKTSYQKKMLEELGDFANKKDFISLEAQVAELEKFKQKKDQQQNSKPKKSEYLLRDKEIPKDNKKEAKNNIRSYAYRKEHNEKQQKGPPRVPENIKRISIAAAKKIGEAARKNGHILSSQNQDKKGLSSQVNAKHQRKINKAKGGIGGV